jgi:hypothetical protein
VSDRRNYEGKLVARLNYRKDDADVSIPVRLVQDTKKVELSHAPGRGKGSRPTHTKACAFRVYLEEIGVKPPRKDMQFIEATDIEHLRSTVMEHLDEAHDIPWEEWYLVKVDGGYNTYKDNDVEIGVSWSTVYVCTMPDGRVVHRTTEWHSDTVHSGLPWTGLDRNERSVRSLIRATEQNTRALEEMRDRITDVRKKLMDFLSPKKIEDNLATVVDRLLPRPEE